MTGSGLLCTAWRKSSRSGTDVNCVEVAAVWRRSSRSGGSTNCVEAAPSGPTGAAVRDSKGPTGPVLRFSSRVWYAFLAGVKRGDFPAH